MVATEQFLATFWREVALHLWQTTLVLVVLVGLRLILRSAPARYVNALWWLALIKLLLPVALLAVLLRPVLSAAWIAGESLGTRPVVEFLAVALRPQTLAATAGDAVVPLVGPYMVLTALWACAGGVILARWVCLSATAPRACGRPVLDVSGPLRARLLHALAGTSIAAEHVEIAEGAQMPMVVGVLRPRIVIPELVAERLAADELRLVLLHEDAHRRRRDPLRVLIARCAMLLFFFYPPVWWLVRGLRESSEIACDEFVLGRGARPDAYARTLARTLALGLRPVVLSTEVGLGRRAGLKRRLDRIEDAGRYRDMKRHRWVLAAAIAVIVGAALPFTAQGRGVGPAPATLGEEVVAPEVDFPALNRLRGGDRSIDLRAAGDLLVAFRTIESATGWSIEVVGVLPAASTTGWQRISAIDALERIGLEHGLIYDVPNSSTLVVRVPHMAGVGGVGSPKFIEAFKVLPEYPEQARLDKVEGRAILQAVVRADGSVDSIRVLRADSLDFGENGKRAVQQWRYEPATLDGVPVDVLFTVFIEYKLE